MLVKPVLDVVTIKKMEEKFGVKVGNNVGVSVKADTACINLEKAGKGA